MKKIAAGLIAAAIMINGAAVLADEDTITPVITEPEVSTDPDTQYITVSGTVNSDNDRERVTLRVTIKDIAPAESTILHTYQVNTDENGEYSFGFSMPDGAQKGDYDLHIKSESTDQLKTSFRYFGDVSVQLKNDVNGASGEVQLQKFFEESDQDGMVMFGIDTEKYNELDADGKSFVVSAVYQTKNSAGGFTNGKHLRDTFNQALMLEAIHKGKAEINDDNIKELTVNYSSIKDGEYNTFLTLYDSERKAGGTVTEKAMNAVAAASVKDAQSFWDAYNNSVVNSIISSTEHWTEVRDFVDANKEVISRYASVNWDKYNSNSQAVCKAFVRGNYTDMDSFAKAVANAVSNSTGTSGSSGGSSGGGLKPSSVTLPQIDNSSVGSASTSTANVSQSVTYKFDDVRRTPWANDAISYLVDKKVISGYGDGTFRPEKNITRAEFVTLVIKAFYGNAEMTDCEFTDVDKSSWAYPYIAAASNIGLVNGVNEYQFAPDENIRRQDIAVIINNVLKNKGYSVKGEQMLSFVDENDISDYALDAVNTLKKAGVINGFDDNSFKPLDKTTRAEASVIMYNVMGGMFNE